MKINLSAPIHWLSFFRVSIASLCLFNFLSLQLDFNSLFGSAGYAPPEISRLLSQNIIPSFLKINNFINDFIPLQYNSFLLFFRIIYLVALVALLLGYKSRLAAVVSLLLFVLFTNSYSYLIYGFDVFANFGLFYCVIFPVGKYNSLSSEYKKIELNNDNKYLRLLQIHLCIAYFFSGFEKLLGFNWRNGESLWKALHSINYTENINLDFLANTHFFLLMGWATIILEMLYPIFINIKKTRLLWLVGMVGLHLSIALLMGLYFFSGIMIVLNFTCYYFPYKNHSHPILHNNLIERSYRLFKKIRMQRVAS